MITGGTVRRDELKASKEHCHPKANAVSDVSMLSGHRFSLDMHAARRSATVWQRVSMLVPWHHLSVSSSHWIVLT